MKKCSKCGFEMDDNASFCPECGTSVANENQENNTSEEVINEETEDDEDDEPWYKTDIFHLAIAPLIRKFDNGSFFLLTAITIIDILAFSFLLYQPIQAYYTYKDKLFEGATASAKSVGFIIAIVVLIFAIFTFGYWMKRIRRLKQLFNPNDEFVVIPLGSYLFQWLGEWLSLLLLIGGIIAIVLSFVTVGSSSFLLNLISGYGWNAGIIAIIASPIIVFLFRIIAEKVRALTAIANNTSRLHKNNTRTLFDDDEDQDDTMYNVYYIVCIIATVGFLLAAMFSSPNNASAKSDVTPVDTVRVEETVESVEDVATDDASKDVESAVDAAAEYYYETDTIVAE